MQAVLHQSKHPVPIETLTHSCACCVDKCQQILGSISESIYISENPVGSSSVGAHVRHIIERFNCFLAGYPVGQIDYDLRKRDRVLELKMDSATAALFAITNALSQLCEGDSKQLQVRESVDEHCPAVVVNSTVERELMGLISHTIHHLAIIVMLVKSQGMSISEDLGKAPSTIIYERQS